MSRDNTINVGGSVSQASLLAGDQNKVKQSFQANTEGTAQPKTEDLQRSLEEIRALLSKITTPDRNKLDRALDDAKDEAAKPEPDKAEVADAVNRVVKYAKAAEDIGQVATDLQGPLSTIAGWVGAAAPIAARLFGLSP
jgi:hypothetical protein